MTTNRSVPTNTLMPHINYANVADALAWLTRVFGFAEHFRYGDPDGTVDGAQMRLGNAHIMLRRSRGESSPATLGYCTQFLSVFLPDVDSHYTRVKEAGALIWEELHETVYGERQYGASDLDGHRWVFSEHVRDLSPADWGATIADP
jgi:uncharacterized glyoxalase superfamily protein PhnB